MAFTAALSAALAWLGRRAMAAFIAAMAFGLVVPPLAAALKPYLTEQIFVLLCLSFLRVAPAEFWGHFTRPHLVVAATAWTMLAIPMLLAGVYFALGLHERAPALLVGLVLQAVAPPLLSGPAFAAVLGLDAALMLSVLVVCIMVTPVTAPAFTSLMLVHSETSALALGIKLFVMLAGAALTATLARRFFSTPWVERRTDQIDGLSVAVLCVFAITLMDGLGPRMIAEPLPVVGLSALAFGFSIALAVVTMLVFRRTGRARAFPIALASAQRNMGIMVAATGTVPDIVWLYFALLQIPIFLVPYMLIPIARRLLPDPAAETPTSGSS